MKKLVLFFSLLMAFVGLLGISGHITSDTTWDTDQIVTGTLYIDAGVTLNIVPGVHVTFPKIDQNADGIGEVYIEVSGRLQVQGTVANKVMFTSNQTNPAPSDWLGIKYITPQSGMLSTISNAEILYAHEPLLINGRNMTLNNVRIASSGSYGMRINNTFLTTSITYCTIEENAGYGLLIEAGPVNITGLNLFHNGDYGIKLEEASLVSASDIVSSTNSGHGIFVVNDADAAITNSIFVSNELNGAELQNCTISFLNCEFSNNTYGVNFSGSTGLPIFNNCSIRYNDFGVRIENQPLSFSLCNIELNTYYGVFVNNATPIINNCNITGNGNHTTLDPVSLETITVNTWTSNSTLPVTIWNQMNDIPYHPVWIESLIYKKDGDGYCSGLDYYQHGNPYWYRNYSRINIGTSTYLDHQYSQYVTSYAYYCPIHGYGEHMYFNMGEIEVGGDILRFLDNQEDMSIEVYYAEHCPNARAWTTTIEFFHMRQVDCIVLNTNSGQVVDLQNNWWGDVEYITSNVQQYIAGTANLNGAAASRITNAGSILTNLIPSISMVTPVGMTLNPDNVNISWIDRDLDDNAMISLYYTNDPTQTGTLIVENISEDSNTNSYTWNCADVPYGTYYIKAIIYDGVNPPVTSTSSGRIMIGELQIKMPTNATGVAGTTVEIPVQTVNTVDYFNIISFQLTLTYNNNIIQATGINTENTMTGETWTTYYNTSTPGQITVNAFSTQPLNSSGDLIKIIFNVMPGAINYATSPLNFADCVLNAGTPVATLTNGLFRVVNQYYISGNVEYYQGSNRPIPDVNLTLTGDQSYHTTTNQNGYFALPPCYAGNYTLTPRCYTPIPVLVVTPYDAALTAQYALGLITFTNNQQKAADVNGDFQTTVFDAALIAQYSVGIVDTFSVGRWGFSPSSLEYNLVSNFENVQFLGYAIGDPSGNWGLSTMKNSVLIPLNVSNRTGNIINIPIVWNQPFHSAYIQLSYNQEHLQLRNIDYSSAVTNMQHYANDQNGTLKIALFGVQPVSSTEPLCNIQFDAVVDDASNMMNINLEAVQFDEVAVDLNSVGIIPDLAPMIPLQLNQNYPNPFNPVTNISFSVPKSSPVKLNIFNIRGELVKTVINETKSPGNYQISFDASGLSSGIYFYRLETDTGNIIRKMMLCK